jgi:Bacterial Ig-like domain (group 3)
MRYKTLCAAGSATALSLLAAMPLATGAPGAAAQAVVSTQKYTIGNGLVTGATAVSQPDTAGATANYTVGFTTPSALSGGSATITLASSNGTVAFPGAANAYFVVDNSHPSSGQSAAKVVLGGGGHSATITLSQSVPAGTSLSVYVIGATNPSGPGSYSLEVWTSANPVPTSTADFQVVAAAAAPSFAPTASPALVGGTSTYTIGAWKAASPVAAGGTIVFSSSAGAGASDNVGFPTTASYYKVNDLTAGTSAAPQSVNVAPAAGGRSGQQVTLTLSGAIAAGAELSVTVGGVRNPTSSQSDTVEAEAPAGSTPASATLEIGTSVTAPTIALSEAGAGSKGVEYTVGFRPITALPAGGTITLMAPAGTNFAGASATLVDSTHVSSSGSVATGSAHVSASAGSTTDNVLSVSVPKAISAGDSLFLEVSGATNPPAGSYGGSAGNFTVATSTDVLPAPVPSYTVSGAAAPVLASVEVAPTTPQASASYVVGDLRATSDLVAGSATVTLDAPHGTVLPGAAVDYTVADLSGSRSSTHPESVSGGGTSSVTLRLADTIPSGSFVDVEAHGVVNPGPGTYQLTLTGDLAAAVAPSTTTPAPPTSPPASPRSTATSLSASSNPVRLGKPVTYVATVSPSPNGGYVLFERGGKPIPGCSSKAVNGGRATCVTTFWKGGHYAVQALYNGTARFHRSASSTMGEAVSLPATGYWLLAHDGAVFGLEGASNLGGARRSAANMESIAGTPSGQGYWVVTSNGTVSAFGNAKFYGDLPSVHVHAKDIVAIAPTFDGHGYWLIGRDGGMFTFGDAHFHGSIPGLHIHVHDVVGMVANAGGGGYLLVGDDGGVFTFGKARFYGSLPGIHKHVHDVRAILPSSAGTGYVLVGADGGVFNFGTGVRFHGSLPGEHVHVKDVVGIALTPDDGGYFMAGSDGHVYGFGNAHAASMPNGLSGNLPVVAIAGT